MESDASSSTISGSKVFGSERKQKRNSPPLCENAAAERRAQPRRSRRKSRRIIMQSPLVKQAHWRTSEKVLTHTQIVGCELDSRWSEWGRRNEDRSSRLPRRDRFIRYME